MCVARLTALRSSIFIAHQYSGRNNDTLLTKLLCALNKDLMTESVPPFLIPSKTHFSWWLALSWGFCGKDTAAAVGSDLSISLHSLLPTLVPVVRVPCCISQAGCIFFLPYCISNRTWALLHSPHGEILQKSSPIELSIEMNLSSLPYPLCVGT